MRQHHAGAADADARRGGRDGGDQITVQRLVFHDALRVHVARHANQGGELVGFLVHARRAIHFRGGDVERFRWQGLQIVALIGNDGHELLPCRCVVEEAPLGIVDVLQIDVVKDG